MITSNPQWRALQREAQLAAEQIAQGVTALGRANHAQTGLYAQAFFGLSIGLERLGKLIFIADHAIRFGGRFPTNDDLKNSIGHDIRSLLAKCDSIGSTVDQARQYAARPADSIHRGIEETLSEFATRSRYYNLSYIAGAAGTHTDPIAMWWEKVAEPICARHYSARQRKRDFAGAAAMAEIHDGASVVIHTAESGTEISDVMSYFSRAGMTAVVQKYGRVYTLQIVRWLVSILHEVVNRGAYEKRIEPLLGLHEHFVIFFNDDECLRSRTTWSTYRLR